MAGGDVDPAIEFQQVIKGIVAKLDYPQSLLFQAYMKHDKQLMGSIPESKFQQVVRAFNPALAEESKQSKAGENYSKEKETEEEADSGMRLTFIEFLDWLNNLQEERPKPFTDLSYIAGNHLKYLRGQVADMLWTPEVTATFKKLSPEEANMALQTFKALSQEVQHWKEGEDDDKPTTLEVVGGKVYRSTSNLVENIVDKVGPKQPAVLFEAGKTEQSKLAKRQCGPF